MFRIDNVESYKRFNEEGTVINMFTMEPRLFPTKVDAMEYATLSLFREFEIKEHAK